MNPEGAITVELEVAGKRVSNVWIHSTRLVRAVARLEGRPVQEALAMLPALLPICGVAQAVAATRACERALDRVPSPEVERAREVVCALEAIENHAFQYAVDWTRLVGAAPAIAPLRQIRLVAENLRIDAFPMRDWARPGDERPRSGELSALRLRDLHAATEDLLGGPAKALLSIAEADGDFGRTTAPLLTIDDPAWFAERLERDGFDALPSLENGPAESGSLAVVRSIPEVADRLAREGPTLMTRLVARVAHTRWLISNLRSSAQDLRGHAQGPAGFGGDGRGVGLASTGRGGLAHAVTLDRGRIKRWRVVAPTEWTFHPEGVVHAALIGAPASGLQSRVERLVAALDPCVACDVRVKDAPNA